MCVIYSIILRIYMLGATIMGQTLGIAARLGSQKLTALDQGKKSLGHRMDGWGTTSIYKLCPEWHSRIFKVPLSRYFLSEDLEGPPSFATGTHSNWLDSYSRSTSLPSISRPLQTLQRLYFLDAQSMLHLWHTHIIAAVFHVCWHPFPPAMLNASARTISDKEFGCPCEWSPCGCRLCKTGWWTTSGSQGPRGAENVWNFQDV